ncbi:MULTISPECIES: FadD3 family acyl-CoA ligase [unclassified Streptomyces]|uniref:FadD3 family acyl-CoA ligase n=1 Tax=unclassified Streptomyces TaxID=2593676 RepID=UPI001660F257|nr:MULTISPECIES: FadD3 family acyl-CoA ligase [unclassified Streptomyces]MBD0709376.1 fatty acid--CoA ligase [Streptomyces sp. CBMA291]MBD0713861.1 fatty acid--CoA ligase [Streptomyces sp. CBMA370]
MRGDLEWGTIPGLVRTAAERYGPREAVVDGRVRVTYAELGARVERAAAACLATGLRTGDRAAIWAPNTLEWIVAALGAVTAGAVLVPLNTRFKGAEAASVLQRSRARLLFVTGTFLGTSYVASLRRSGADLPDLETVVVLGDTAPEEWTTWKEFLAGGDTVPPARVHERAAALDPHAPSDIVYTSGTTGRPKGAVISHAQSLRCYAIWSALAGLREGDRYLVVNPFFHTFGYKAGVLACLMRGAVIVPQSVFTAEAALAHISAERITVLPGPPTLHQSLLDHPARAVHDLSSLRLVVTGAAVVPLRLVERLRTELGVGTVLTAYGLSEASGIVTMCRRDDPDETVATTSGRPIPGTELRLSATGEILVRGHHVMRGYFEDEEATAAAVDADGWLHTGDVGELDEAGNLRITDRLKDMYIVGGFNAYPAEIEQLLGLHPDLADVAVVGVPDPRLGEVGKAFAVRRPGARLTADDLIAWARRAMANYKVPREVVFVPALPRNASGKVLKGELRARREE